MKKRLGILVVIVILVAMFAACATTEKSDSTSATASENEQEEVSSQVADSAEAEKISIGISFPDLTDDFNKVMYNALVEKLDGMTDEVEYTILDALADTNKQLSDVDMLIAKKVDVIIMIPFAADALVPAVEAANAANITMIEINARTTGEGYIYVGSEDIEAGRMQGEYLAEILPENANVCYIIGQLAGNATIEREAGLTETLFDARPDITLLAKQTGNWARAEGMKLAEDWLQQYPEIDAIISQNDESAMGALEAVKTANRLDEVIIIGVDGTTEAIQSIVDGGLSMTVFQDGVGMATQSIDVAIKVVNGEWSGEHLIIPFAVVDINNADEYMGKNK